ncbi:MAG TPA: helix-turn-helix domain-containing protein [Pseudonocardia sp.]|jgi:DNA-binding HxlR family transcriptional regulator|nr:helix-turn-helix domain-containing protein [Pseudonocardia sp.]
MPGPAEVEVPAGPGGSPVPRRPPDPVRPGESGLGRALALLGDSWTLLILQRAFLGVRRYGGWRTELGISDSVLAGRLRALATADVLAPHPYRDGGRTRHEYRLTERGLDLWALLVAIWSWERAWVPRAEPLPDLVHRGCGQRTDVTLTCGGCGAGVTARDTAAVREPGVALTAVAPPRLHPRRTRGTLPTDQLSWFPGTVEVLGDRWSTCVLGGALLGMRTFGAFRRELDVSPDVLSDRLRRFLAHGILVSGPDGYRLTRKGLATFPMLAVLVAWGERWLGEPGENPPLRIVHRCCRAVLDPRLGCRECGAVIARRDVGFVAPEPR